MKVKKKKSIFFITKLFVVLVFIVSFFSVISDNFKVHTSLTYDVSKNRSVQAMHLVSKYVLEEVETITVSNFNDMLTVAPTNPVIFTGTMTGYGPDCEGCGGRVGCSPYQNVKNGNIYFNDNDFGKVRIIAGDKKIPCGTIIKISNLRNYDEFYAIVLDRGGAIKGTLFDLLYAKEKDAIALGRASATYMIVRWGW